MHADKTIIQTIFTVQFTSRSFPHLGRGPWMPCLVSPPGICLPLALHWPYCLIADTIQWLTLSFSKDPSQWGKAYAYLWGHLDNSLSLGLLHLASMTYPELSPLISLRVWGRHRKIPQWYGLLVGFHQRWGNVRQSVWSLHCVGGPVSGQGSTMEEVVRQLTALVSSGPNWPYTLVQLNEDTHHAPLPREGHWGDLTEKQQ